MLAGGMMPFRHGSAKGACVAIQLIALLMLQGYFLAPVFLKMAKSFAGGRCFGNHRLCGCAPERIANKTCCCFGAVHSCCMLEKDAGSSDETAADTGGAALQNSPCGLFSDSGMLSLDNVKFLASAAAPTTVAAAAPDRFPPFSGKRVDRPLEPPDPPPRIIIPV